MSQRALPILLLAVLAAPQALAQPQPVEGEQEGEQREAKPPAAPEPEPASEDQPAPEPAPASKPASKVEDEAKKRERQELERPRPALPEDVEVPEAPPWERRLEVGADFVFMLRPFTEGGNGGIAYDPAPGWGVHLRWNVLTWLRVNAYFMDVRHGLDIPQDALRPGTTNPIRPGASIETGKVRTFVFGVRGAPTYNFNERCRGWLSVGIGWGRFNYPSMTVTEVSGAQFEIRERSATFAEVPIGLGLSFDIIENWLTIEYEAIGAPAFGQSGEAHQVFQVIDADGLPRDVAPINPASVSFVQTLGLSIIL